ncbi:hypothetical protein KDN34_12110 [Shewanella yunxiaonensis]|uniref:MSHA biogenesis protein MshJ n=1 Tax=Shewanella yunxiaonensis TaxID=2829809 RepID=A0ABX7YQS1_9GAMM|nr:MULTISPECIES: DUF6776 family protein [Shewanella]MDF0533773.1 hypothetical protein [Shewanella sp. A32]QUN04972.1 hypothetical protein KDN34_12110 [Shewanella yunxiaonensis]
MANYHRWLLRLQLLERSIRPSSLYLLGLLLVAFAVGALSLSLWQDNSPTSNKSNVKKINQLTSELNSQSQILASRNLELQLAKESNKEMQEMFAKQHQKQQDLERELAFYRSIMAPENNVDGVAINGIELQPGHKKRSYRLRIVLTQLQKRKQSLTGRAEVSLQGLKSGKENEIQLESLIGKDKLGFSFKYFQVLEVEFVLPEAFELQRLSAKVIVPASRWSKGGETEQSYSVPELLTGEKDSGIILEQESQVLDNPPQQSDVRGSND